MLEQLQLLSGVVAIAEAEIDALIVGVGALLVVGLVGAGRVHAAVQHRGEVVLIQLTSENDVGIFVGFIIYCHW